MSFGHQIFIVHDLLKGKDDSCMKEYDDKESKRKQKTKDSIKLE
jgi:hypothetical protein